MADYRNLLDKLIQNDVLTKDGRDWLIAALDPFHDEAFVAKGYPDINNSATIVQCIKQQLVLTVPTALEGQNWDCHISLLPTLSINAGNPGVRLVINNLAVPTTVGAAGSGNYLGGCSVVSSAVGAQTWDTLASPASTALTVNNLTVPANYAMGAFRIVGMGFEVTNTTAPLYRQGSVTVYRQPVHASKTTLFYTPIGIVIEPIPYTAIREPPATLAYALLYYGSRTWAAEDGCYVVARLNSIVNQLKMVGNLNPLYLGGDLVISSGWTVPNAMSPAQSYPLPGTVSTPQQDRVSPYDISGAYFSGLSPQTSLILNVRWYIERCPTVDETDLVVLATPSPCYDEVALSIYSHAMCTMPIGVLVNQNPLGEWFHEVLSSIASALPYIGAAIMPVNPLIGAIATGAGALLAPRRKAAAVAVAPIPRRITTNVVKRKVAKKLVRKPLVAVTSSKKRRLRRARLAF